MASILIAAGGTGGHLYPALAVAGVLRDRGHDVAFVGGARLEQRLVPAAGYRLHTLAARALPRSVSPEAAVAGIAFLRSVVGARRLLRALDADVVLGMGSYPSLAPAWAAGRRRTVVLHEQNAMLSLAHRLSVRRAGVLALSLPLVGGPPRRRGLQVEVTGNPLRPAVRALAVASADERGRLAGEAREHFGLSGDAPTVLAFGGSLGALVINEALPIAARDWGGDVQVLHVTGPDHEQTAREAWDPTGVRAVVRGYVDDMELAYAVADVVVSRSGASTVAEVTALGIPAVFVPLPSAPGGVQEANARVVASAGGAEVALQSADLARRLAGTVGALLGDAALRSRMGEAARALGRPDATERLADVIDDRIG